MGEAAAQLLPRCGEPGPHQREEGSLRRHFNGRRRVDVDAHDGGRYLGRRVEGAGAHHKGDVGGTVELRRDAQQAALALRRRHALRDLALHRRDDDVRLVRGLQEAANDGGRGVVGEVGDHLVRLAGGDEGVERRFEGVGVDDLHVGPVGEVRLQGRAEGGVELQRDDAARSAGEDLGQRAEAGADLDDGVVGGDVGGVGDALEDAGRDEEVLAEALAGLQAKPAEQPAGGGLHG